jgi:hypothetical protein
LQDLQLLLLGLRAAADGCEIGLLGGDNLTNLSGFSLFRSGNSETGEVK